MEIDKFTPIENLKLSTRSKNALLRHNVFLVGQLIKKSPKDLLDMRSFGDKCLFEVMTKLTKYNLRLKDE